MQWDSNSPSRADLLKTALPASPVCPVVRDSVFPVAEHAYSFRSKFEPPVSDASLRMFDVGQDWGPDFECHKGLMQIDSQVRGGVTPVATRLIFNDVVIADSGSLALLSPYAPRVGDGASASGCWPGTWSQAFPTGFSSGLVSGFESPAFFSPFESLVQVDFSNAANRTGKNLVRLYDASATLDVVEVAVGSCLDNWTVPSFFRAEDAALASFELSTEAALGYFNIREPDPVYFWNNAVLSYVIHAEIREALVHLREKTVSLLVQISYQIQSLGKVFFRAISRYCGLSWARRAWCLLHGSHPPKTGRWHFDGQSFGCAKASA